MNILLQTNVNNVKEFDVIGRLSNGDYVIGLKKNVKPNHIEDLMEQRGLFTFSNTIGNMLVIGGYDDEHGVLPTFLDPSDIYLKQITEQEMQLWQRSLN